MKRKYNEKFSGVFAWFGNKYGIDPLFMRVLFIAAIFNSLLSFPLAGLVLIGGYMLADLFIIDENEYEDEENTGD